MIFEPLDSQQIRHEKYCASGKYTNKKVRVDEEIQLSQMTTKKGQILINFHHKVLYIKIKGTKKY